MLAEIEIRGECDSLCHLSGKTFDIYPFVLGASSLYGINIKFNKIYPEMWDKRNTDDGMGWWFKSTEERIAALKQCIAETAPN